MISNLELKKVNRFIPFLLLLGVALGLVEIFMGSEYNSLQVILIHILTTFLIGYAMVLILINERSLFTTIVNLNIKYFVLLLLLVLVSIIASEIEQIFRTVAFDNKPYQFFSGGNIYLLNTIVTITIAVGSYLSINFIWPETIAEEHKDGKQVEETHEAINQIPIKQGDNIFLHNVEEIAFFEAYDNYSMVFDLNGKKQLCDFSLRFLESKLSKDFIRIHRKHIINKNQISKIQPHLNGRYNIEMKNGTKVMSSKSYAPLIKAIIKLS